MTDEARRPHNWFDEVAEAQAAAAAQPVAQDPSAAPALAAPLPAPAATPARGGRLVAIARKASWNLVDQMLSSLSNIVLTVVVAKHVDAHRFGAFSVAMLLFSLLIAAERALVGQPLSIRHSHEPPAGMRIVAARALGTVTALAVPAGVVLVVVGLLLGGSLAGSLAAVGVVMPALLLQDTCRMIFFAQSRAQLAALNDAVWAVVQFAVMGVLVVSGHAGLATLLLAWGGSAGVGVLLATAQLRVVPRPAAAAGWVREHCDLLAYLLPETLTTSGGDKAAYFMVGGIVGQAGLGAVNAARQLLNPLLIVSSAASSFTMPEISRRRHLSPRARALAGTGLGLAMALSTLAYLGLILMLPGSIFHWLLEKTWQGASTVLLPMGLFSAAAGLCLGPFVVIAAMGHAKRTFRVTVLQTVLMVVFMPVGAYLDGAPGAAWGLLAGKLVEIPFWFGSMLRVVREGPARGASESDDLTEDDSRAATVA